MIKSPKAHGILFSTNGRNIILKNLKKLRLAVGLSQQALGEQFHISQQAIHKYENGLAEPDIQTLKDFSDFFNTTTDYLIGYTPKHISTGDTVLHVTPMEQELIQGYRLLDSQTQEALLTVIRKMVEK